MGRRSSWPASAWPPDDVFVEIGPGLGALTRPLAATGVAIRAIEVDRDLAAALAEWAPAHA